MAKVLVPLAQGCEELEAVTIIDVLRRGGIEVTTTALDKKEVRGSRATVLVADTLLDDALAGAYDMVVLPGGMPGSANLKNDTRILALLKKMAGDNKYVAAICAAPMVLAEAGVLAGKHATGYPGCLENLKLKDVTLENRPVVKDGKVITSQGPGTAMDFALELVETLAGRVKRDEVEAALQRPAGHRRAA
ncbi:MAG: DJ-1 family glyoxalase III [Burkholderiales bacterium]